MPLRIHNCHTGRKPAHSSTQGIYSLSNNTDFEDFLTADFADKRRSGTMKMG